MSSVPIVFPDNWYTRPSRILDQHFGLGLAPMTGPRRPSVTSRYPTRYCAGYCRPWQSAAARGDTGSVIKADKDQFQVNLDVQQFKPDEITVKVNDKSTITVEGKHEVKQDEHGFVSRHFVRRYVLPDDHDINNVASSLSSDGVLSITAPRIDKEQEQRTIPIQQTGVPSKPIEKKRKRRWMRQTEYLPFQ